jgi:hypothetical protein
MGGMRKDHPIGLLLGAGRRDVPPHEQAEFLAHVRGLAGLGASDQESVPTGASKRYVVWPCSSPKTMVMSVWTVARIRTHRARGWAHAIHRA